jgi:hypothetical protein
MCRIFFAKLDIDDRLLKCNLKPRTYREKARQAFWPSPNNSAPAQKQCAGALTVSASPPGHIEQLLAHFPEGTPQPLPGCLLYRYWVIQHLYQQQTDKY